MKGKGHTQFSHVIYCMNEVVDISQGSAKGMVFNGEGCATIVLLQHSFYYRISGERKL